MRDFLRALACLLICATTTACLRKTEFHCTTDADCSGGGFCESNKFCSFTDTDCSDGRRYGDFAGSLSNQCVGSTTDAGMVDSPGDGSASGCPNSYGTISGGGTHLYRQVVAAQWASQRVRCEAEGAYLAVPDDMAEIQGIVGLGAAPLTWIGIHDQTTEGMFETVRGGAASFLPWLTGEPNNQGEQDCVSAIMSSGQIQTDRCTESFVAVCECEP
jgi:hypothetical protein